VSGGEDVLVDVLVDCGHFISSSHKCGLKEITTVADVLHVYAQQTERWIVLQLHSTLSIEEQDKVTNVSN